MSSYIIRDIHSDLWHAVKVQAAKDGVPIRTILIRLLALYAEGRIELIAREDPEKVGQS